MELKIGMKVSYINGSSSIAKSKIVEIVGNSVILKDGSYLLKTFVNVCKKG